LVVNALCYLDIESFGLTLICVKR